MVKARAVIPPRFILLLFLDGVELEDLGGRGVTALLLLDL